ncbi:MAG: T9SS C-terminal target domain-containing protein, partial [Bacteroidetes bacterium]
EWEEITFDFSDVPNNPDGEMYDQIIIFPDFDDRDQDNIVYFDNITFNPQEIEDGTDATLSDLMVDGVTVEGFSPSVLHYSVLLPEGTVDVPVVTVTTNDPEASAVITPATELPGTTSVLVTSANTEVEQTYTVEFSVEMPVAEPEVAAPTPPARDPEDVISVFSEAYTNLPDTDFFPNWGQTTVPSIVEIEGVETLKYENFNYQGTQFAGPVNALAMEYLHLDMWTADATSVNVFIISEGPVETAFALPITPNEWVSYDIPLSAFAPVNLSGLIQLKFDGGDGSQTIYLDNIYFYIEEVEEGSDATLSDLMVDGTTVSGFSPSVLNYTVVLPEGTTDVPVVTATTNDPDATAVVTPATELPGTTSVLVTSANTEVEQTYTITFSIGTTTEGPRNPIDFEPDGYGADWTWTVFENETNPPLEIINNPDPSGINTSATVAKFTALEAGNPWAGVESAHGDTDLGTFLLDETNSTIKIMVWKPVISDVGIKFATASGWAQPEIKVSNTLINEWEEITFDFSDVPNNPDGEMYDQIIIFPDFDDRDQDNIVYFDNITFNPLGIDDGTDATLSDLMVDGVTVEGFSPSVFEYSVVLPAGTTDVPVVTATTNDPDASAVITPATELPGTTSILVTSANTEVEQTYTVVFSIATSVVSVEEDKLILYPNPAEAGSKLHLSVEALQIDIFDLTGKSIVSGHNTSIIDTYGMKQGIYMVRIITHSGLIETRKLIVK